MVYTACDTHSINSYKHGKKTVQKILQNFSNYNVGRRISEKGEERETDKVGKKFLIVSCKLRFGGFETEAVVSCTECYEHL